MKVGGQILWNITPICETSQIYCLMGKHPMKDVLANHLKDLLFHLVHWLRITPYCEGGVDVVSVITPLRGVAQVVLHGDQVVELSVLLGVHQ